VRRLLTLGGVTNSPAPDDSRWIAPHRTDYAG
jgi:hypothetical protein